MGNYNTTINTDAAKVMMILVIMDDDTDQGFNSMPVSNTLPLLTLIFIILSSIQMNQESALTI